MFWEFWWHPLNQYPPRLAEVMMLSLAMGLLGIWGKTEQWPYLVLSLSFVIGASTSVIIRESFSPSQTRFTRMTAFVLLVISVCGFIDLARYFYQALS